MSKFKDLSKLGQSIWYDYIQRTMITSGQLADLVSKGLGGVTSNPSIFEQAISGSSDYDVDLNRLIAEGKSVNEIYESLVVEDIAMAADALRPVYDATGGKDGFVSLEVNPGLAHQTEPTIAEARRLFETVGRPNVMIKVPATPAGIPAISALIGAGVNVNVTLIFAIESYRDVAGAYIEGLELLSQNGPTVKGGQRIDTIGSVASFFVSRVDTAVDKALEKTGHPELQGKIAIANAKVAYALFQEIFSGDRWDRLARAGARVQRVLWASTGTKNPNYVDTMYVDELIGKDTVNTLPPATLNNFLDHGTVAETLTVDVDEARRQLHQLDELGVDLGKITDQLQVEGVDAFARSFDSLIEGIAQKRKNIMSFSKNYHAQLGGYQAAVDEALKDLKKNNIMPRIWNRDHTVWKDDPAEITNRLGWLDSPQNMRAAVDEINAFVKDVRTAGFTHALLLGMGGSSLAPEVFRLTFGIKDGFLDLDVLDSTDPGAVAAGEARSDPSKTLYLVSTKSGGTVETFSFLKHFYNIVRETVGEQGAGNHFAAITDPGSGLEETARTLKFRKTFLNDPNIGGRYSALSYFGLVPAALIGLDLDQILDRAAAMAAHAGSGNRTADGDNTAAWLGVTMGELARAGRDKLTLITSPALAHFGAWAEQLIAESTGKEGKGILPVAGETIGPPAHYSNDRLFVYLRLKDDSTWDSEVGALVENGHPLVQLDLDDLYDLNGEYFRWEVATAVAGMRMGINPFDQPNVEAAKILAREMVAAYQKAGKLPELQPSLQTDSANVYADVPGADLRQIFANFFNQADTSATPLNYVAVQAYVTPSAATDAALQQTARPDTKKI